MSKRFNTAMDILRAETRAALRRLLCRPAASLVSVLALACGIDAAGKTTFRTFLFQVAPLEAVTLGTVLAWGATA